MRYAALNQYGDNFSSFGGFIPVMEFMNALPPPQSLDPRYSDEQLYAVALYVYSLKPPKNPNVFDDLAARGQKVFLANDCQRCHTPPHYTNNKLTPAVGFDIPRRSF